MVAGDRSAATCSRIAFEKQIECAGAAWLHALRDNAIPPMGLGVVELGRGSIDSEKALVVTSDASGGSRASL